jgi:D-3-phosphoglycerate dehydrogenase / 2-oxoglutarate reductase
VSRAPIGQNFREHQAFDAVRPVTELVAGRLPPHAVNADVATRLARLRKA